MHCKIEVHIVYFIVIFIDVSLPIETVKRIDMSKKKILCIDQSPELIEIVRRILEHGGIEGDFLAAMEGQEGLKMAFEESPDLIILDMHLPGGETWDLLEQIRSDKNLENVMIIGLSKGAYNGDLKKSTVNDPQPDVYLQKPLDVDKLLDTVKRFIR